jgi:hypothetical protein
MVQIQEPKLAEGLEADRVKLSTLALSVDLPARETSSVTLR